MGKNVEKYIVMGIFAVTFSCGEQNNNGSENADSSSGEVSVREYIDVVRRMHNFECDYMTRIGIRKKYASSFEFRSDAFQEILKDLNRANLVKYESINYQLADVEHKLNDEQKKIASAEMEEMYQKGCNEK